MRNGLIDDDAFAMTGWWFNPHSGDCFEVRDCFCDGNDIIVTAKDGRTFKYEQIEDYIQTDGPIDTAQFKAAQQPQRQQLPPEVSSILQNEYSDDDPGLAPQQQITSPLITQPAAAPAQAAQQLDEDALMVKKMLSKALPPDVKVTLKWDKFPVKQMDMLVNYMCVDEDKIVSYFESKFDMEFLKKEVIKQVRAEISKQMKALETPVAATAPKTVSKAPVSKAKPVANKSSKKK